MLTVASIAKRAFDGVARRIGGVIHAAKLKRGNVTDYDPDTAEIAAAPQEHDCRVLFADSAPTPDPFPNFEVSPGDQFVYLEGLAVAAQEGDTITLSNGTKHQLIACRDLLNSGAFFVGITRSA